MERHASGPARRAAAGVLVLALLAAAPAAAGQPPVPDGEYVSALLMNADTGEVLYAKDPHLRRPPASMVKMMLMLLVMEKLEVDSVHLDDPVPTSAKASRMGGSQVYLKEGEVFSLEEMMQAVVIHSANDAAVAVAEFLTGSEEACVDLMNRRARELGMNDTVYHSVTGLPPGPGEEPDLSSAHDLAVLGRALIRYPKIREWGSTRSAPFRGGRFLLTNTNQLIGRFRGADGIKTGYYAEAGYGLTATAARDGLRMLAVVLGAPTERARFREAARLLGIGFNMYKKVRIARAGEVVGGPVRVSGARIRELSLVAAEDLFVHVRRGRDRAVETRLEAPEVLEAPLRKGQPCGALVVTNGGRELGRVEAVAPREVPRAPLCVRILNRFR